VSRLQSAANAAGAVPAAHCSLESKAASHWIADASAATHIQSALAAVVAAASHATADASAATHGQSATAAAAEDMALIEPVFNSAQLGLRVRHHLWEVDEEAARAEAAGEAPSRVRHWSDAGREDKTSNVPPMLHPEEEPFDVVMGSDLLYFSNQETPLLAAIARRLDRRRPGAAALICQTMRRNNRTVWERFVAAAHIAGFDVRDEACGGGNAGGWEGCGGGGARGGGDGGAGEALSTEGEAEAAETLETQRAVGYRMLTLTWRPENLLVV